ncbi:AI-2E family transporter, partial [Streptomyces sparsogenes]
MSSRSRPPDDRRARRPVRGGRRGSVAAARARAAAAAGRGGDAHVHPRQRLAAGDAWRLLVVGAVGYGGFKGV